MKARDSLQFCISGISDIQDAVSNFLFENGALGVWEQDAELVAYFDESCGKENIVNALNVYLRSLQELYKSTYDITISVQNIPPRDWNAEWKKSLQPLPISDNILIKPSWVEMPDTVPSCVIEIDPEMAFGSGEHSTTKMTLQLVEKNMKQHALVLDIGAGTGILSIGALLLGAGFVYALDVDPLAAETAKRNAEKNGVAAKLSVFAGTLAAIADRQFDIIAANVNRTQIVNMLPQMRNLLASDGVCLISGIMDSEEHIIRTECDKLDLVIHDILHDQEWLAFETRKR